MSPGLKMGHWKAATSWTGWPVRQTNPTLQLDSMPQYNTQRMPGQVLSHCSNLDKQTICTRLCFSCPPPCLAPCPPTPRPRPCQNRMLATRLVMR